MKYIITLIITLFSILPIYSQSKTVSYKQEGKTFISVKTTSSFNPIPTGYTWKIEDKSYPIYMGNTGSCFIMKISKKTNKPYRYYLPKEVSQTVCKALGKTYKPKN